MNLTAIGLPSKFGKGAKSPEAREKAYIGRNINQIN